MSSILSSWQNTSQHNALPNIPQVICVISFVILSFAAYNFKFLIKSLICLIYLFSLWSLYHIQRILVKSQIVRIPMFSSLKLQAESFKSDRVFTYVMLLRLKSFLLMQISSFLITTCWKDSFIYGTIFIHLKEKDLFVDFIHLILGFLFY